MTWTDGPVEGVITETPHLFSDHRGWLAELFRQDELSDDQYPAMGYVSVTHPGVARGPHEHEQQSDRFGFFHGTYSVFLWDARTSSPTYGNRMVLQAGGHAPLLLVIPPGVVHAYRNDGTSDAFVLNFPDALYAGPYKKEPVDEIRHEDDPDSPYRLIP